MSTQDLALPTLQPHLILSLIHCVPTPKASYHSGVKDPPQDFHTCPSHAWILATPPQYNHIILAFTQKSLLQESLTTPPKLTLANYHSLFLNELYFSEHTNTHLLFV